MTTWTLHPATTQIVADLPLNSGVARKYMQDNCLCNIEQSGYDLCSVFGDAAGGGGMIGIDMTTSWAWATGYVPIPIPIFKAYGGGWRELTFSAYTYCSASDFDLRFFLLDTPHPPTIDDTSGDVSGVTSYVELKYTTNDWEWQDGAVTPDAYEYLMPSGLTPAIGMPVVYVHIAGKAAAGTPTATLLALQIAEAY